VRPRRRIFRRYAAYFVTLVSGAMLLSGASTIYSSYHDREADILQRLQEKAVAAGRRIDRYVNDIVTQVNHHLRWVDWPYYPGGLSVTRLECILLLRQVPAVTDVQLLDADGKELLLVSRVLPDRQRSGKDFSHRPAFLQARSAGSWFGPVYFRRETEPYMTLAIASGEGTQATVTLVELNLKFMWDIVSGTRVGRQGYAYIVDNRGYLVAHPDTSLVLRKTNLARLRQVATALASSRPQADRPQAHTAPAAMEATNLDGEPVLSAHASTVPDGWVVFVEQPEREAYDRAYANLRRTGLLLLLGLLLALPAAILPARRMSKPIRALQLGAAEIAEHNLSHRIHIRTGDELEALADEFNRMAARLEAHHKDLETQVEARTRQLAAANRQLETANRHKSEFLANMSHELRTPLNSILGFSEVLKMRLFGELNPKQAEYIEDIHASGRHLLALINEILDLAKIEAGRMELEPSRFDVAETLGETLVLMRETAAKQGIGLHLEAGPELGEIRADRRKLKQILLNLLSNALKFTPAGGQVRIIAHSTEAGLEVTCADTGVGIPIEQQAAVFEEFKQVPGGSKVEGTGLGLALTKRLVTLHGGTIRVRSRPGKGTAFTFTIPRRP
jgi:signal transduction histidine kinase